MAAFTIRQLYTQDSGAIAVAFSTFCNSTQPWTAAQCNTAASAIAANKPSFGKRAGNLCQALGVCNAPGSPAMASGCLLKVSTPALVERVAQTFTQAPLDICAVEGLKSGGDVPGTTRLLTLPTGAQQLCFKNDHVCCMYPAASSCNCIGLPHSYHSSWGRRLHTVTH
jgi:hypothetical protein